MRTALVTDALQMAIDGGHVADETIFHSDRGTQPGLNRSSQHQLVPPRVDVRQVPRLVSST
jgi:transposase InsO family protein